jgi:hypothetical protein
MNRILKLTTNFFAGWSRLSGLGAVEIVYAWYWLRYSMTPDEHRREAEKLRREHPDDAKAQASATKHEQIATFMEAVKVRQFWWSLLALLAMYAFAHWVWPT